jgi:hypothetical protein
MRFAVRTIAACAGTAGTVGHARAGIPAGDKTFERAVLLVSLGSVVLIILFGVLILGVAHIHRKRDQRHSGNCP